MPFRLFCSPIAAAVVPGAWRLACRHRRRRLPFPYVPAVLVSLAPRRSLVIDLAGNATRLYVDVEHFDDAVHFVHPMLLVAGAAVLLAQTAVPDGAVWVMAFGRGCASESYGRPRVDSLPGALYLPA